jgi:hypothetical protein
VAKSERRGTLKVLQYRLQKECSTLLGSDNALKHTLSNIEGALLVYEVYERAIAVVHVKYLLTKPHRPIRSPTYLIR